MRDVFVHEAVDAPVYLLQVHLFVLEGRRGVRGALGGQWPSSKGRGLGGMGLLGLLPVITCPSSHCPPRRGVRGPGYARKPLVTVSLPRLLSLASRPQAKEIL